jgi:hypothetical protein
VNSSTKNLSCLFTRPIHSPPAPSRLVCHLRVQLQTTCMLFPAKTYCQKSTYWTQNGPNYFIPGSQSEIAPNRKRECPPIRSTKHHGTRLAQFSAFSCFSQKHSCNETSFQQNANIPLAFASRTQPMLSPCSLFVRSCHTVPLSHPNRRERSFSIDDVRPLNQDVPVLLATCCDKHTFQHDMTYILNAFDTRKIHSFNSYNLQIGISSSATRRSIYSASTSTIFDIDDGRSHQQQQQHTLLQCASSPTLNILSFALSQSKFVDTCIRLAGLSGCFLWRSMKYFGDKKMLQRHLLLPEYFMLLC